MSYEPTQPISHKSELNQDIDLNTFKHNESHNEQAQKYLDDIKYCLTAKELQIWLFASIPTPLQLIDIV